MDEIFARPFSATLLVTSTLGSFGYIFFRPFYYEPLLFCGTLVCLAVCVSIVFWRKPSEQSVLGRLLKTIQNAILYPVIFYVMLGLGIWVVMSVFSAIAAIALVAEGSDNPMHYVYAATTFLGFVTVTLVLRLPYYSLSYILGFKDRWQIAYIDHGFKIKVHNEVDISGVFVVLAAIAMNVNRALYYSWALNGDL